MSIFAGCELAPPDPILGTALAYKADPHPDKVNLGIGAYRNELGNPEVLEVVRRAELAIAQDLQEDKEYAPIDGHPGLKPVTQKLLFGETSDRIASSQALSGTGALRLVAGFAKKHLGAPKVFMSKPTWGNHPAIFKAEGLEVVEYPYWDKHNRCLDFTGMIATLNSAPRGSLILLHACAHNPTGESPAIGPGSDDLRHGPHG